ncbi:S-layer homology domain-containing protein [Paenibacillus qinlingensis]|uniref:Uncharacterized protein n=1 Tax=Paenibacillus qinlingensis TaxID=1837343 RepID=A0ABU1P055_9BACL|nr:S-layer homology domain-containing protein [Paenibacillus qinlingensis]MDR6553090.1 hypothetical protein [Paenibacillus qinlingensis]
MKKTLLVSSLSAAILMGTISAYADTTNPFTDITGSYAKDAIIQLQKEGILTGIDAEHFDPQGTLTRAQFVTILVKALGLPIDQHALSTFTDVDDWAIPYIEAAKKAGIIDGLGGGLFGPNANITREQTAVVMVKALISQGVIKDEDAKTTFTDADSISDWALKYVALAQQHGLLSGNPDGSFNPQGEATREQAAVMGANLIKTVEEITDGQVTTPTPTSTPPVTPAPTTTPAPVGGGGGGGGGFTADTTAPTAPTNVIASNVTQTGITLTWTASTDSVGVTGYDVYQGTTKLGSVNALSYEVTGLTANTSYSFTVKAKDLAGNVSVSSTAVAVTTAAVTPPVITNPQDFIQVQDFGYWADATPTSGAYNVGFKLDLTKLPYENIKKIEVALVDAGGTVLGKRTATGTQITKLAEDDALYGNDLNGELSAAFTKRDAGTNDYWTSIAYDFTTPSKAIITITDNNDSIYTVENSNLSSSSGEIANPQEYVQAQDFGYFIDATPESAGYNVGFKLDVSKLAYSNIRKIEVALVDASNAVLATRTATGAQITKLMTDDITYGGLDGQLSAAFIKRAAGDTNEWWTSSAYDFATPAKTVITITDSTNRIYKVENSNLSSSSGEVANPQSYIQTQDFGYWADQEAFNVGFKFDVSKISYDNIRKIEVSLVDANNNVLATRTATGSQIVNLKDQDAQYSGAIDGELSSAFTKRTVSGVNQWWSSSVFDFTTPAKAVIKITDSTNRIFKVENNTLVGTPVVASPPVNTINHVATDASTPIFAASGGYFLAMQFQVSSNLDLTNSNVQFTSYYEYTTVGSEVYAVKDSSNNVFTRTKEWGFVKYVQNGELKSQPNSLVTGTDYVFVTSDNTTARLASLEQLPVGTEYDVRVVYVITNTDGVATTSYSPWVHFTR